MRSREQHLGVLVSCASVVLRGSTRRKQAQPAPTATHSSPGISQARLAPTSTPLGFLGSLLFSNLGRSAPSPLLRLSIDHKTFDVLGPESNASPAPARSRTIPSHRRDTAPYPCSRGVRTELDRASRFSLGARFDITARTVVPGNRHPKMVLSFFSAGDLTGHGPTVARQHQG